MSKHFFSNNSAFEELKLSNLRYLSISRDRTALPTSRCWVAPELPLPEFWRSPNIFQHNLPHKRNNLRVICRKHFIKYNIVGSKMGLTRILCSPVSLPWWELWECDFQMGHFWDIPTYFRHEMYQLQSRQFITNSPCSERFAQYVKRSESTWRSPDSCSQWTWMVLKNVISWRHVTLTIFSVATIIIIYIYILYFFCSQIW